MVDMYVAVQLAVSGGKLVTVPATIWAYRMAIARETSLLGQFRTDNTELCKLLRVGTRLAGIFALDQRLMLNPQNMRLV